MEDFSTYYFTVGHRPNNLVTDAVRRFVTERNAALDLGCGNFRDSRWLKQQGFTRVVSVDPGDIEGFLHDDIEFVQKRIEDFPIEEYTFDFIAACNVFHYLHVDVTAKILPCIMRGLRRGGVFAFNVLGERDSWVTSGHDKAYFTKRALESITAPYLVKDATEMEISFGKKWHMHYCVLGNHLPT